MNDRFKFRCFSRKTKKMYEVDSLHLDSKDGEWVWVHYYNPIYDKDLKIQIVQPNVVIMQYTGLKDKNDNLIYEGDILRDDSRVDKPLYIVTWIDCSTGFGIKMISPCKYELYSEWHLNRSKYDYVVVGNIYENKELLNE